MDFDTKREQQYMIKHRNTWAVTDPVNARVKINKKIERPNVNPDEMDKELAQ